MPEDISSLITIAEFRTERDCEGPGALSINVEGNLRETYTGEARGVRGSF